MVEKVDFCCYNLFSGLLLKRRGGPDIICQPADHRTQLDSIRISCAPSAATFPQAPYLSFPQACSGNPEPLLLQFSVVHTSLSAQSAYLAVNTSGLRFKRLYQLNQLTSLGMLLPKPKVSCLASFVPSPESLNTRTLQQEPN